MLHSNRSRALSPACLLAVLVSLAAPAAAAAPAAVVENPSFEDGSGETPAGWKLSGAGRWLSGVSADGRRAVAVSGTGSDSSAWYSSPVRFEPGRIYRLRLRARGIGASGGTITVGPVSCNMDLGPAQPSWRTYQVFFVAAANAAPAGLPLRLGQWHVHGQVAFDAVELARVVPVHARRGEVELGAGESITPSDDGRGAVYTFSCPFGRGLGNYSRPLLRFHCGYNSNRWRFAAGSEVVYRQQIPGRRQRSGTVKVQVCWYDSGELLVQARADGGPWRDLGTIAKLGEESFDLPAAMLPAERIDVRLAGRPARDAGKCSLQVGRYVYRARLDGPAETLLGRTDLVVLTRSDPRINLSIEGLGEMASGGGGRIAVRLANGSRRTIRGHLALVLAGPGGKSHTAARDVVLPPGGSSFDLPGGPLGAGDYKLRLSLAGQANLTAETAFTVPCLYDASYGRRLGGAGGPVELWWASSGWKISRRRPAPTARSEAMVIRAAGNEAEAAQLVIRPRRPLKALRARVEDLAGPGGAKIPAGCVELLRVRYVPVTRP
ncbi:MAG: hypothetical protein J7M21_00625, partial [Planctomycetes bacterium]|nr:hypothetical protein [Planctomycetota bacterium]